MLKTRGEIIGGACTCVAGKGQAYIHIAALLFYLEDSAMVWSDTLPPHNSETNVITSPGLIPINTLNVLWCLQQHRICLTRCILAVDCSFPVQPTRSSAVHQIIAFRARFRSFTLLSALILPTTGTRTLLFLSAKMFGMKSTSFESLDGLINEICAAEAIRRLRCHISRETARI